MIATPLMIAGILYLPHRFKILAEVESLFVAMAKMIDLNLLPLTTKMLFMDLRSEMSWANQKSLLTPPGPWP